MGNGGNWSDILNETGSFPTRYDAIRHKYIEELEKTCNRNVICYYSGWQQNKKSSIDINLYSFWQKMIDAFSNIDSSSYDGAGNGVRGKFFYTITLSG